MVPQAWLSRIDEAIGTNRRQILCVERTAMGGPSEGKLEPGDVILEVNGVIPIDHRSLEEAVQASSVMITVWREGREVAVPLEPVVLSGDSVDHIVHWAGAVLHAAHPEVGRILGERPYGVHVASGNYGSPSYRCGVEVGSQIVSLNGQPTPDLTTFIAVARKIAGTSPVVVRFVETGGVDRVVTLLPEMGLWPTYELRRQSDGEWERVDW